MDLFDFMQHDTTQTTPLAERMRPTTIQEFCGQSHLISPSSMLFRAISLDRLGSCIFWGPPGCGKTTLANIIASTTKGNFVKLNAVSAGVADVKRVQEEAEQNLRMYGKKTYLLLDECHRWNKAQSDSMLEAIEKGHIIFIGATTENPFVSMTRAIVSRLFRCPSLLFLTNHRQNLVNSRNHLRDTDYVFFTFRRHLVYKSCKIGVDVF